MLKGFKSFFWDIVGIKKNSFTKQKFCLDHARKIWGVICNSNCLLSKELMAKYSKKERIFSVGFKPFNYWGWKGVMWLMSFRNSAWVIAKWCIGDGTLVSLNHPTWFKLKEEVDWGMRVFMQTIADLIDWDRLCWKFWQGNFTNLQWPVKYARFPEGTFRRSFISFS